MIALNGDNEEGGAPSTGCLFQLVTSELEDGPTRAVLQPELRKTTNMVILDSVRGEGCSPPSWTYPRQRTTRHGLSPGGGSRRVNSGNL